MTISYEEIERIKKHVDEIVGASAEIINTILIEPSKESYPDSDEGRSAYISALDQGRVDVSCMVFSLRIDTWSLAKMRDSLELPTEEMIKTTWAKIDNLKAEIDNLATALLSISKSIGERFQFLKSYLDEDKCNCKGDEK